VRLAPADVATRDQRADLDSPLVVAHRGASAEAPENTLAAVRSALARDSDLVEVDVQRSKDGALVLMHDTTLARTTNVRKLYPNRAPWLVGQFTYAELSRLDAGSWKAPRYAGERIPTLEELVEVVRRSRSGLLLELKAPALYPGIVREVTTTLAQRQGYLPSAVGAGRLVVESFSPEAMWECKNAEPSIPVGLLGTPSRSELADIGRWADQVNPSHLTADAAYVSEVHRAGLACLVWTVNRPAAMRRALRAGVDGVITNRPDVLHGVLAGTGQGSRRTSFSTQ
jgi:glycerophosphoryl diester phosphodiesterase